MAVQARTALGTGGVCISPSAKMSGNASHPHGPGNCMGGLSPGYWVQPQKSGSWTPYIYPTFTPAIEPCSSGSVSNLTLADIANHGTPLSAAVGSNPPPPSVGMWYALANPTDSAVFGSATRGQLLRHLSAAFLNANLYGSNYPITTTQIKEMWQQTNGGTNGLYCPTAGSCSSGGWTATEVKNFIEQMYHINTVEPPPCKKNA